jgi:MbtH protein
MSTDEREDTTIYKVVMNHEEQYSIWPADRENALGWTDAGKSGTKQECLDYIQANWTTPVVSGAASFRRTHPAFLFSIRRRQQRDLPAVEQGSSARN